MVGTGVRTGGGGAVLGTKEERSPIKRLSPLDVGRTASMDDIYEFGCAHGVVR